MKTFNLIINKNPVNIQADPDMPLLWAIRDMAGLMGTKFGCGLGLCGACTVHLDGEPIRSCQTPLSLLKPGQKITTIEGLSADHSDGGTAPRPVEHVVQQAWIEHQVPQCGYCQSGQIMSAVALLKQNPNPSDADIDGAMAGNICRCGTYNRIREAIHTAAKMTAKPTAKPVAKPASAKKLASASTDDTH